MAQRGDAVWHDLTVPNADEVRDFYSAVIGWQSEGLDMGGYQDYVMAAPGTQGQAGICHTRGPNANMPGQWLVYFQVPDLDAALAEVIARGGKILDGPREMGGRFACIQDPAGAVCSLFQPEGS